MLINIIKIIKNDEQYKIVEFINFYVVNFFFNSDYFIIHFQAFWYVENKGAYDGPVFGSSDKWVGLGVFFDSFDNDNKHHNPYIMAMANDGTKEFDHTK